MAKIIRKGHQLEEKYYALKQEQANKRAKNLRILIHVLLASITVYSAILIISVATDLFPFLFIPTTACIGFILLAAVLMYFGANIPAYNDTDILVSGISGERIAAKVLATLPDRYTVFQNVIVYYDGKKSEIDNIVVGNSGVFIIEVKNHNGHIVGDVEDTYWTQHKVGRGGTSYANEIYSPVRQVGTQIYCLANYLRQEGVNTYIQGMVYFVNKNCQVSLTGTGNIFVYSNYDGNENEICRQILSGTSNLDHRSINHICKLIDQL